MFATQDYQTATTSAKEYVIRYGLAGKVKILRHEGQVLVVTAEPLLMEIKPNAESSCGETEI